MLSASEITAMTATQVSSFDTSVVLYRKSVAPDAYGHSTETWTSQGSVNTTLSKPTGIQLTAYASIIGSQKSLIMRYAKTSDVREGDRIAYDSNNWLVQYLLRVESYTFVNDCIITVIT